MDFEKPKSYALIVLDVIADVTTFQLWCRGSTFGVATLNFACSYNVATLGFNVATWLFGVANVKVNVVTLL